MSITMNNEQFDMFLRSMSNLADGGYTDVDIRDGIIRSRNISRTMITEVDLRPIFGEIHLPVLLLKQKIELLKCFKNSNEVKLEFTDDSGYYKFSDDLTSLKFRYFTDPQYVDNKHMDEQELQAVTDINEDDVVLSTSVDQITSNRIRTISSVFNVEKVQFDFHGNSVDMTCQGTEQSATFLRDEPIEEEINGKANIIVSPFNMDYDDNILINLYKSQKQNTEMVLTKTNISVGDINMTIYVAKSVLNPKE